MGSRDASLYFTRMVVLLTATPEQEGVAPASKTTVRTACRSVYHFDADIQLRWRKTQRMLVWSKCRSRILEWSVNLGRHAMNARAEPREICFQAVC